MRNLIVRTIRNIRACYVEMDLRPGAVYYPMTTHLGRTMYSVHLIMVNYVVPMCMNTENKKDRSNLILWEIKGIK